ncbi:MAG: TonB-dependent receptor [Burkholderiales bacterium]|nr:TonB-dependent receptor [Burkholderiales bacterium]
MTTTQQFPRQLLALSIAALFPFSMAHADDLDKQKPASTVLIKGEKPAAPNVDGNSQASVRSSGSDTASLLRDVPGISVYGAGGVSSLPAIHGLADDRLRIQVDGMNLISACANHMNPPLSYIDPTHVGNVQVLTGVTPVSHGGDSIGGTILVNSPEPEFASDGQSKLIKGQAGTFYRSNGNARGANLSATYASDSWSVNYAGSIAEAGDYHAASDFKAAGAAASDRGWIAGDVVGSSRYRSENQSVGIAVRNANQLLELKLGMQNIPYQGFPNQRMDMTGNSSEQVNVRYQGQYQWGRLEARLYNEHTRHRMNFGDDKQFWYGNAPGMPMDTEGKNTGAVVKAILPISERDTLTAGAEMQRYRMNDWWSPSGTGMMMAPNTFVNIADGQRDRLGVFAEWDANWNAQWMTQLGARFDNVKMDSGKVAGYGSMAYGNPLSPTSIPGAFNAANRQRSDHNIDLTATARYTPSAMLSLDAGYAMKTRSPNLYERYVWASNNTMVMNMNNWYGDGNGYVGNLNLAPEIAHTLSFTASWHDAAQKDWELKVSPYYTKVHDYIDATTCAAIGKICMARKDGFLNLSLSNQNARLYGVDISGKTALGSIASFGSFSASGMLNYVNGKNETTGSGLYNIMPLNAKLALVQELGNWSNTVETQMVAAKTHLSAVRQERATAGYTLLNLRSSYIWKQVRVDFGIENALNRYYQLPLGGAYIGQGATMGTGVPAGTTVPGMGRSVYAGVTLKF